MLSLTGEGLGRASFGQFFLVKNDPHVRLNPNRPLRYYVALLTLSGALAAGASAQSAPRGVVLIPGDYVRVTVWRKPELSGEFLVAADSTLKHPLYQEVKVGGLGVAAAQERLRSYLTKLESSPQISIEPLFQVTVGGEVRSPNLYKLSPETNIAQAVALAGGPNERGRLEKVHLLRGGRDMLLDLTQADASAIRMTIESGDRIVLERRREVFRDVIGPLASLAGLGVSIGIILRR